jgi:hypothetical protein
VFLVVRGGINDAMHKKLFPVKEDSYLKGAGEWRIYSNSYIISNSTKFTN